MRIRTTAALLLLACGAPPPPAVEPPPSEEPEVEPPAVIEAPSVEDDVAPDGPSCEATETCADGQQCRGPAGCESPWACGEPRACGEATISYCGCDGFTFYALENCPGKPIQHVGPCPPFGQVEEVAEENVDEVEGNTICTSDDDCRRGYVCAGAPGCSTFWTCVRRRRLRCTRERAHFCSCEGESFEASADCPGRPIAHEGYCAGDEPDAEPRAAAPEVAGPRPCMSNRDCPRGLVCQGSPGCADEWTCARPETACVDDTQYFCGCDGESFRASMSCPGRPHRHRGSCRG